jgi:hypothetical protein
MPVHWGTSGFRISLSATHNHTPALDATFLPMMCRAIGTRQNDCIDYGSTATVSDILEKFGPADVITAIDVHDIKDESSFGDCHWEEPPHRLAKSVTRQQPASIAIPDIDSRKHASQRVLTSTIRHGSDLIAELPCSPFEVWRVQRRWRAHELLQELSSGLRRFSFGLINRDEQIRSSKVMERAPTVV